MQAGGRGFDSLQLHHFIMNYKIRKITPNDIDACFEIQQTSHFHTNLWPKQLWQFLVPLLTDSWVAVDKDDNVVAYVMGMIRYADELDGELAWFWTELCQKKGVKGAANDLAQFILETYPMIYAYIDVRNVKVEKYLTRHNFKTIRQIPNYYYDSDALLKASS